MRPDVPNLVDASGPIVAGESAPYLHMLPLSLLNHFTRWPCAARLELLYVKRKLFDKEQGRRCVLLKGECVIGKRKKNRKEEFSWPHNGFEFFFLCFLNKRILRGVYEVGSPVAFRSDGRQKRAAMQLPCDALQQTADCKSVPAVSGCVDRYSTSQQPQHGQQQLLAVNKMSSSIIGPNKRSR